MRTLCFVILSLTATIANAARYELSLTRIGRDLYKLDIGEIYVKTKGCEARLWKTTVTLSFNPALKNGDSLIFKDGSACKVISVFGWDGVPYRKGE